MATEIHGLKKYNLFYCRICPLKKSNIPLLETILEIFFIGIKTQYSVRLFLLSSELLFFHSLLYHIKPDISP